VVVLVIVPAVPVTVTTQDPVGVPVAVWVAVVLPPQAAKASIKPRAAASSNQRSLAIRRRAQAKLSNAARPSHQQPRGTWGKPGDGGTALGANPEPAWVVTLTVMGTEAVPFKDAVLGVTLHVVFSAVVVQLSAGAPMYPPIGTTERLNVPVWPGVTLVVVTLAEYPKAWAVPDTAMPGGGVPAGGV